MNKKPFKYHASNGTKFSGECSDLSKGVKVERPDELGGKSFCADCIEFGAWHQREIWPNLNGFQGYDCFSVDYSYCISFN